MRVSAQKGGDAITLQIEEDDIALAHVFYDGATAEQHIHLVAAARAQLAEEVTPQLDPGARMEGVVDPVWRMEPLLEPTPLAALSLRHPGMGWIGFLFPPNEARSLGQLLLKFADEHEAPQE